MLYEHIAQTIQNYGIPRGAVALLAGLWPTDLSAYLNGREDLPAERVERVTWIVNEIVRVIETAKPLKLDLRDPQTVQELIHLAQEPEDVPDLDDLRKTGAEFA